MSFNINNWGTWSVSYNSFPPKGWAYTGLKNGESDTIDDMKVDGFFDEASTFLEVGHLIYLDGVPIAPIFPSRELVVVTGLDPITIKSLNGVVPLFVGIHTTPVTPAAVGLVQVFPFSGIIATDLIVVNKQVNPNGIVVDSATVGTDTFTLTFNVNPGAGMTLDVLIFRQSFL